LAWSIQPKLAVSAPDDPDEREADRIADTVMRSPQPVVQRKCAACSAGGATCPSCEEEETRVQRKADGADAAGEVGTDAEVDTGMQARLQSPSGGRPLPEGLRRDVEPVLGTDLSHVRVHDSAVDRADADRINAKAFTYGTNIWIGSTGSAQDRQLMAHELAHVAQQTGGIRRKPTARSENRIDRIDPPGEQPSPDHSATEGETFTEHNDSAAANFAPTGLGLDAPSEAQLDPTGSAHVSDESAGATTPAAEPPVENLPMEPVGDRPPALPSPLPPPPPQDLSVAPNSAPDARTIQRAEGDGGGLLAGIRQRLTGIVDGLRSGWNSLTELSQSTIEAIRGQAGGMVAGLANLASTAMSSIQSAWTGFSQIVRRLTEGIKRQVEGAMSAVTRGTQAIGRAVMRLDANALRAAWSGLVGIIGGVNRLIVQAGPAVYQTITRLWQGLRNRFDGLLNSLTSRAREVVNRLRSAVDGLRQRVASAWAGLRNRAAQMSGVMGGVLDRLQSLVSSLISWGRRTWESIQQQWRTLTSRIGTLMQAVQQQLSTIWQQVRQRAMSLWNRLSGLWARIWQWVQGQVGRLVAGVRSLWSRIRSFSIGSLVEKIRKFGAFVRLVEQAVQNPDAAMKPFVDAIAGKLQAEMPARAIDVGTQRLGETAGPRPPQSTLTGVIQRQPATPAPATTPASVTPAPRTTATWSEIWSGFVAAIQFKWSHLSIWKMVKDMLWSVIWPWPAVGHELVLLWTVDLTNAVHSLFLPRNPFSDFWGFLHDVWTDILHLLDIPLAILRRLNNIALLLMGWVTIGLMILGAIGGSVVVGIFGAILGALAGLGVGAAPGGAGGAAAGGFAGAGVGFGVAMALGEGLVMSFLALQGATLVKTLVTLWTAEQTPDEKDRDYSQLADNLIAIGVTLVLLLIGWLASKLASTILGVIEGKLPPSIRGPLGRFGAGARSTGKAYAGRDLDDLARDPAHGNQIGPKSLHERRVGLDLESRGDLPGPIRRDPNPAGGEFIDANGVVWDIKGFNSNFPPRKGGFEINRSLADIQGELNKGENVILDTSNLSQAHLQQLRAGVTQNGWGNRILWWP
jgi:Domain of unknown function (DUF4157)